MSTQSSPSFLSIQYLRAFAALAVALSHTQDQIAAYLPYLQFENGKAGVDLFFVISGFIMVTAARARNGTDFIIHRLIRIVPLYWACTLAFAAIGLLFPQILHIIRISPEGVAQSLLFVPYVTDGVVGPLLPQGWTLNYEMVFYLIFAALFFLPLERRVVAIAIFFAALIGVGFVHPFPSNQPILHMFTNPLLLEFVAGMCVGLQVKRHLYLPPFYGLILIAIGALLMVINPWSETARALYFGAPAALVVYGAVSLERAGYMLRAPLLKAVGDASYSLYLTHLFAYGALRILWSRLFTHGGYLEAIAFVSTCLFSAVVVGYCTHIWLERPITRTLNRAYELRHA